MTYLKLCCVFYLCFSINLSAQENITLINKDSIITGYSLIYGHTNLPIIDFEVLESNLVVMQSSPGNVSFLLLNKENFLVDTVNIKCWPLIEFWRVGNKFFFHPMILYKNEFCAEDGRKQNKGQIVTFEVINDNFTSVKCISTPKKENEEEFVYISPTSTIRQFNKFKKGNLISSTIYINDTIKLFQEKFVDDRELYAIKRTKSGLIVLDIKNSTLYEAEDRVKIYPNVLPKELSTTSILSLDFDLITGKTFLLSYGLHDKNGNETISLYGFNGTVFEHINQPNLKRGLKTKIRGNRIYSLFNVDDKPSSYYGIFQQKIIAWE